jgi:hypothetical protein
MARGKLGRRIRRQPGNAQAHMDAWQAHPVPPHEMTMPVSVLYVSGDATVVEEAAPLVTNRGVVPATGRGQWDQVMVAGKRIRST